MRLAYKNIHHVTELTYNGVPYSWRVAMKSNRVSDGRSYHHLDVRGRSGFMEYPAESLPVAVQKFIKSHPRIEDVAYRYTDELVDVRHYRYTV